MREIAEAKLAMDCSSVVSQANDLLAHLQKLMQSLSSLDLSLLGTEPHEGDMSSLADVEAADQLASLCKAKNFQYHGSTCPVQLCYRVKRI